MAAIQRPEEVDNRIFRNVYVCMRCNATVRGKNIEKLRCRKCGSKRLRPKNRQLRAASKK